MGQGDLIPTPKSSWDEATHSQAAGTHPLQAVLQAWPHSSDSAAAPSVFIFPWVERELLESCSGEVGCGGPRAVSGSWRPRLCAQELEGTFCLVFYSDRPSAPVLAWGSERQACSHTSCVTAKPLRPLLPPTVIGREAFLTFFPEKRGETSEFGGHHVIQIAI